VGSTPSHSKHTLSVFYIGSSRADIEFAGIIAEMVTFFSWYRQANPSSALYHWYNWYISWRGFDQGLQRPARPTVNTSARSSTMMVASG